MEGVHPSLDPTVLKYLSLVRQKAIGGCFRANWGLPSTEATGEGTVQSFSPVVIRDLLLPDREIGTVITNVWIQWWQWSAVDDVGRLLSNKVCFEGRPRSFVGHDDGCEACSTWCQQRLVVQAPSLSLLMYSNTLCWWNRKDGSEGSFLLDGRYNATDKVQMLKVID